MGLPYDDISIPNQPFQLEIEIDNFLATFET